MYFRCLPIHRNLIRVRIRPYPKSLCMSMILLLVLLCQVSFSQTCATNQYAYAPANLCINCPLACATCSDSMTCLNCQSTATIVATLGSKKCYCQNGKYYDPFAVICDVCNKVILNCKTCSVGLSSTVCLTCNDGYYLYSPTSCAVCPPKCTKCLSATQCIAPCIYGEYQVVNGDCVCDAKCSTCAATYDPACTDCDNTKCKKCGVGSVFDKNLCKTCSTGCLKCGNNLDCQSCFAGYFLDKTNKICVQCSTFFNDAFCTQCEQTQCTVCVKGYRLNMATRICVPDIIITCLSTEVLIDTKCIPCLVIFDPYCSTCDTSGCIACQSGYMIDPNTNTCMKIPICGDGDWVIGFENCDDRNTMSGDGCSATCQVQTDYQCLEADKLTTGESFCKYTKDFVINLMYVHKQQSSNIAYFYFNFEGSTFQLWTETQLISFLNPIEILDANTGTGNVIPYNSLAISFNIVNGQTLFSLAIDYGLQNIENAYIKFAMDPSQTSLTQINTKPPQPTVFHFIDSKTNGVNLYNYAPDIYEIQTTIFTLSGVLGYTAFIFLLLGMACPVGKLIVLEALAVIQLGFFTVLQFDKIPPTFIGLKNLLSSSGINDLDLLSTVDGQYEQIPYRMMGLDNHIFANYNLSFILLFSTPLLLGIIGLIIIKFGLKKLPRYTEEKNSLLNVIEKKRLKDIDLNNHFTDNLRDTFFKRMVFQVSFFGLLSGGYLSWVSIFYSLKTPDGIGIFGFVFILVIWLTYAILYYKVHTEQLYMPPHYIATFEHHNTFILTGFGQFRDVYQQISRHKFYYSYAVEKVYLAFVLQRIIIPMFIVYVSDLLTFASIIIAVVYLAFLLFLIISYRKYQNKKVESERIPLLSFIHRNYALRQSINLGTTIVVQLLYFIEALKMSDTGNIVDTLSANYLTTQLIPILILSFLYINFIINIVLWIWELKSTEIVRKTREMKKFFFSEKDLKPYAHSLDQKKRNKSSVPSSNKKQKQTKVKRSVQEEDKVIEDTMKNYAEKTNNLNPKKSPFSGYTESESKQRTIEIESIIPDSGRKLNNQMPTVTTKNQKQIYSPHDAV